MRIIFFIKNNPAIKKQGYLYRLVFFNYLLLETTFFFEDVFLFVDFFFNTFLAFDFLAEAFKVFPAFFTAFFIFLDAFLTALFTVFLAVCLVFCFVYRRRARLRSDNGKFAAKACQSQMGRFGRKTI